MTDPHNLRKVHAGIMPGTTSDRPCKWAFRAACGRKCPSVAQSILIHSGREVSRSRRLTRHACARACEQRFFREMHENLRKMPSNCARYISRKLKFPLENLPSVHSTFKITQSKLAFITLLKLRLKFFFFSRFFALKYFSWTHSSFVTNF